MFDINKYNITETELNQYRDNLIIDIGEWSCEKWNGESFNGNSSDLIREHHGEDFYVYRKDGIYQFISNQDNLSEFTLNMIDAEKDRLCEEYFLDRLFPVDENGNPIKPNGITDTQLLMQEMTDAEIRDFEIQQGQELIAQQLTDIELSMLERSVI